MESDLIKIKVCNTEFMTARRTLSVSVYFSNILNDVIDNSDKDHTINNNKDEDKNFNIEIFVDRSATLFEHVLAYMRDPKYPFPIKYIYELDFYGVAYPKYNLDTSDTIKINTNGTIFEVQAAKLMKGSNHLFKLISNLYVGQILYLDVSPKCFKHILSRIYDSSHVIPIKYMKESQIYSVQKLTLHNHTTFKFHVSGRQYKLSYKILCRIPVINNKILKCDSVNGIELVSTEAFDNILRYLNGGFCDEKYQNEYELLGLKPNSYYRENYVRCKDGDCNNILRNYVSADAKTVIGPIYCCLHRCQYKTCGNNKGWFSEYCDDHRL